MMFVNDGEDLISHEIVAVLPEAMPSETYLLVGLKHWVALYLQR